MRIGWALAAAAVLLAGCYASDKLLLDPTQAAAPLAVGRQQASGGETETVEISLEPDHWYRMVSGQDDDRVLFTPLAGGVPPVKRYAFAFKGKGDGYVYGVAEQSGGKVALDLPFCDLGPARDAAMAHGVQLPPAKKAMSPICTFTTAADLTAALSEYADRPGPKPDVTVLPAAAD